MHLGNARTALLSWLQVRAQGGTFLLRVEDLDRARCKPELVDEMYRDLEYLGLDWDEKPWIQSERQALYDAAAAELARDGRTYPCFCTRAEIARAAVAPHGPGDDGPRYPGTCRGLSDAERLERQRVRPPAVRFIPRSGAISFVDGVHGEQVEDVDAVVGDFVIRRNDGVASYQLAVVVDDAASGITDVLRGDDLLSSTARQLALYQALGLKAPAFHHVPLLVDAQGRRLAKRDGPPALVDLRQAGVPAERVVGLLAHCSGLGPPGPARARDLVGEFQLPQVGRQAVVVSAETIRAQLGV
jgi:glutamyl-tRNA synthetase